MAHAKQASSSKPVRDPDLDLGALCQERDLVNLVTCHCNGREPSLHKPHCQVHCHSRGERCLRLGPWNGNESAWTLVGAVGKATATEGPGQAARSPTQTTAREAVLARPECVLIFPDM